MTTSYTNSISSNLLLKCTKLRYKEFQVNSTWRTEIMNLPDKPILSDYQELVKRLVIDRGFNEETIPEVFTVFIEEIGELAKAVRTVNGQKVDKKSTVYELEEEAADVFWLLIDLCNRLNIDLEKAFRAKEAKNQQRKWR